jgi:O-antigen ligase
MVLIPVLLVRRSAVSWRQMKSSVVLFAGILILLITAAAPAGVLSRFGAEDPYAGRREFVESSLRMMKDKPLVGFGLGNWPTAYPGYALFDDGKIANQAHNDWAQWAVEGGLPLLAIMLWMAWWAVPRAIASIWGAGVAAVLVHCLVDYPIQRTAVALVFFTMLAAIHYAPDTRKTRLKPRVP